MRLNDKKILMASAFSCLIIYVFAAALLIQPVPAETSQLTPDWTGVTHDFFNLSPGTTNPVLTAASVTDKVAKYVADPFIYHEGNTWYMFFEIYLNSMDIGDIGLATSSDCFNWTYKQVVLHEAFHLAYPQVFKWDGTYYMVPESYSRNEVRLYKATNFPYTWTFVNALVSGRDYVDSNIFRYNNTWWMFAPTTTFNTYLFYSDNLTNPSSWHAHPMNPIVSADASKAREGGRVIVFKGNQILRLAQKCDVSYGEAVRAFQVDTLTKTSYAEHEISQNPIVSASGSGWNKDGMHTVDPWWIGDRWLAAVDGVNYQPSEVWSIGIYVSPVAIYQLTISTNYGTVSPPSGLYDKGATVTITATLPAAGSGERYVWLGWTGSGTGSYTGLSNPASVTINGPINQTASWRHEYYLTVTSPYDTPGGQGWYEVGGTAYATLATSNVSGGNGIRYVFTGWSGNATGTELQSNAITMNGPKTATANWKTQYSIAVTSAHDSPTSSAWVDAGRNFTASVTSPTETVTKDHQWVCTGFSVDGGAYQNGTTYTFTNVQAAHSINFAWKQQFWIQVNSSRGSPTTSQWIDQGGNLTVSVTSPADDDGAGTRYRCTGYKIDDGSLQAGTSYTLTNVQAAHKIEFQWTLQYRLVVSSAHGSPNPTGTNWYDSGTQVSVSVTSPADDDGAGTRYKCTGWGGAGSVPTSGTSTSVTFIINTPSTLTWNWIAQYYLIVSANFGSVSSSSNWYDAGAHINIMATIPNATANERYVWNGWIGTGSYTGVDNPAPITMNHPVTETGSWKLQFLVVFQQTGVPDGSIAHVIVNSVQHILPYSEWFGQGTTVNFAYEEIVPGATPILYGLIQRHILTATSEQSPLAVEASMTMTGYYNTQYTTEISVLLSAIIILGGLTSAIIFLKRRKAKSI